jgi:hypothetical protein
MVRFIRDTEQAIALALFRSIIPEAHYILIPDKSAERFNYQRIMEGLPVGLVVDLVSMVERPIRSGEFYMLSEDPQDGEIHEGYGQMLATSETGILKTGSELTVGEVWRAAQVFVQAKLEGLQDG